MSRQIWRGLRGNTTRAVIAVLLLLVIFFTPSHVPSEAAAMLQQEGRSDTKRPPRPPTSFQLAMIREASEARAEIVRKLQAGQYVEFIHQHSPIDRYLVDVRDGRAGRVQMLEMLGFSNLALTLESLKDAEISVDATGRVATFTKKKDVEKTAPTPKGPYSRSTEAAEGYGSDLKLVIQAALEDLRAKRYERFTERLFPPSMISMMKTDERWEALQASLSPESPLLEKMQSDLESLKELKPRISDGMAEFELPNHVTLRNRREGEDAVAGTRRLKFSLIDGSWRFHDSTSKVSAELDATLAREPSGETGAALLVLEKIGSDWRLRQVPRFQPQAQVIPAVPDQGSRPALELKKSIPAKR